MGRIESDYYNYMEYDPQHTRKVLSYYVPMFAGCSPVVELACGRGEFLELLGEAGIQASGVDSDEGMIEQARATGAEVSLADAISWLAEAPAASAGGAFCSHFIEHLAPDDVSRVLEGVRRILKPGGLFIAVVPNPACYAVLTNDFWRDPTHVRFYQPHLIAFLCEKAGLKVETIGDNAENSPGPPPDYVVHDRQIVHAGLSEAIQEWLRRSSVAHGRFRLPWRARADWEQLAALGHLLSLLSERLIETEETLQEVQAAYQRLVRGMFQSNDVFVAARG
jgi:SAM-dependent methyltransferase